MNKATHVPASDSLRIPQTSRRPPRARRGWLPTAVIALAGLCLLMLSGGTAAARDGATSSPEAGTARDAAVADSGTTSGAPAAPTTAKQNAERKDSGTPPPQPRDDAQPGANRDGDVQRGDRVTRGRVDQARARPSRRTRTSPRWYQPSQGRTVVYGGSWWGGAYGGVGDIYRGMAAIINARANMLRAQSEALINIEEARSRYIDNRIKWAQFYLEWRRLGEQRRREYWAEKRAARDRYLAMIRQREPERLTPSQLDPVTGHINWPVILTDPRFAEPRKKLEELFALRAYAGATPDFSRQVLKYVEQMRAELLTLIRDIPANEYMQARRFLDLLRRETF